MREIKYKIWDKSARKMHYATFQQLLEKGIRAFGNGKEYVYLDEVMEFSGLRDKNDKDIYEGDFLQWFIKGLKNIGVVVYEEYDTAFSCRVIEPIQNVWVKLNAFDYEIIGNIYENPELLNE